MNTERKNLDPRRKRSPRGLRLAALAGLLAVAASLVGTRPASAFGYDFWTSIHERITRNAFEFMPESVLGTIVAGNLDEDEDSASDLAERHATSCRFRDGAAYANLRYGQIVDALKSPQSGDPNRAARLFGHVLHGAQDFYSHSNWIPTPPQGLGIRNRIFESGLGLWPIRNPYSLLFDDVMLVEGNPPAGMSIRLPADARGNVAGAVPIIFDRRLNSPFPGKGAQFRGLMTAGAPRFPGDQVCPPVEQSCDIATPENVCLRHGESRDSDTSSRNFDGVGRMNLDGDGGGDWFEARHHAKLQTRHEWCRLLHLSRDLDPTFTASARLLGTWVDTDSGSNTPHIVGTPCERGAVRPHLVEVTASPGPGAPSVVPFALFRRDFTDSQRTAVGREGSATLRLCANAGEQVVATLIPAASAGGQHVIVVPATSQGSINRDHRGPFVATFTVKITANGC